MICTPKVRHIWRCISVTVVPFYISEPQGSFLCGFAHATVRERFNIISSCLTARFRQVVARYVTARFAKTVEKSGNAWYNEFIG